MPKPRLPREAQSQGLQHDKKIPWLTRGMEANEDLDESGTMPFSGEDMVMTIYDGRPSLQVHHMSDPGPGAPTRCDWGCGDTWI
jgi:hypothetical protein